MVEENEIAQEEIISDISNDKIKDVGNTINDNKKRYKYLGIDVKSYIFKLSRNHNISFYWNANCYTKLKPEEIPVVHDVLLFLYNIKDTDNKGVCMNRLTSGTKHCRFAIKNALGGLIPIAISMKFHQNKFISRYYHITDIGEKICEELIRRSKKQNVRTDN